MLYGHDLQNAHGHAEWTWTPSIDFDMQHGLDAACPCPSYIVIDKYMLHVQVHVYAACPCCISKSTLHVQSMLHVPLHPAGPCPCCMPMPMLDVYIHGVSICLCLNPCVCARVHIHVYVEHRYGHVAWTYKYSKNIRHAARTWTCSVDVDMQLGWPRKWVSTISRNTEFREIHYWFRRISLNL